MCTLYAHVRQRIIALKPIRYQWHTLKNKRRSILNQLPLYCLKLKILITFSISNSVDTILRCAIVYKYDHFCD